MSEKECEICQKTIKIEEDFLIENKHFFHKKCYISHLKKEKNLKLLPKLKKFVVYFTINLIIFIFLYAINNTSNLFLVFILYIMMVLTISFGLMTIALLIQLNRFK